MGVYRLWEILLTIAQQKKTSDLSGMVLAVDASLWIVKVNTIFEEQSAQLNCLFKKLLWFSNNNIRPIFVFDGTPPALKRKTIQERRKRRRQLHNFQITKKVQLQILKKINFPQHADTQSKSAHLFEQKQKQIDEMLAQLLKSQQVQKPIEEDDKLTMQGRVIDKKYQLLLDLAPRIQQKFGNIQYFSELDIETKLQLLSQVQQQAMPTCKQIRTMMRQMSEQQKIIYDMQRIKKKSQIRQLQDNLYRKVLAKKKQNGYQIIQGIYNGKKVVQKRRIKQNNNYDTYFYNKGKNVPHNDLRQIFLSKRQCEKEIQKQKNNHSEDDQRDNDFFNNIFRKDYTADNSGDNRNSSQNTMRSLSERFSQTMHRNDDESDQELQQKNNVQQSNKKQQKEKQKQKVEDYFNNQFNYLNQLQGQRKQTKQISQIQAKLQQQKDRDPDNFPQFIKMQQLDLLCTSSNSYQLQNILDILGVPYVIAPGEAEAQCAYLQMKGIVDGIITEDSDVFLFGGRKVYRGVFQQNIKYYSMDLAETKLHLNRQKLILFAMMLGSDYTDGIKGIGIVNAMQILRVHENIGSLKKFTEWAKTPDAFQQLELKTQNILKNENISENQRQFYQLHRKYKNYWHVHPKFPDMGVYDAYMKSDILEKDKIKIKEERNIELMEKIMRQKFNMNQLQINHNMKILMKNFKRKGQLPITDFLGGNQFARIRSKRLQKAIQ